MGKNMIQNLLKGPAIKTVKNLVKMFNSVTEPLKSVQTSCVTKVWGTRRKSTFHACCSALPSVSRSVVSRCASVSVCSQASTLHWAARRPRPKPRPRGRTGALARSWRDQQRCCVDESVCPDGCLGTPPPLLIVNLFGPAEGVTLFRVCPVHIPYVPQITAPKIPLIVFGRAPAAELSICGRETGKGNGFFGCGARFLFSSSSFCCSGWN